MDDEGKVKDIVSQSKNAFLSWKNLEVGSRDLYDLEVEFAASKKNKNYVVMITLLIFLIAVVGTAYAVTRYIQEAGKIVPIQIKDFEDVNLKDILDIAKNYEQKLKKARADLENIKTGLNSEISNLNSKAERDVAFIMEGSDSAEAKKSRVSSVYRKLNSDTAAVRSSYGIRISEKEAEIAEIEKEMASYDSAALEKARKQDEILNNQTRMAEIQLQQTVDSYEERIKSLTSKYDSEIASIKRDNTRLVSTLRNKYDPVFKTEEIKKIIADKKAISVPLRAGDDSVAVLEANNAAGSGEIASIRNEAEKLDILVKQILKVPYENSVADASKRINEQELFIQKGYESIWQKSAEAIDDKNSQILNFSRAFDFFIQDTGVSGYVLNPVSSSEITVFMNKIIEIKSGDRAYVFRSDNEPIAEIEFYYLKDKLYAREITVSIDESGERKFIQPFDRILVKLK